MEGVGNSCDYGWNEVQDTAAPHPPSPPNPALTQPSASCPKALAFTMHTVQRAPILVTGQIVPLLQNVFQGYLKLPGQNGILILHL